MLVSGNHIRSDEDFPGIHGTFLPFDDLRELKEVACGPRLGAPQANTVALVTRSLAWRYREIKL